MLIILDKFYNNYVRFSKKKLLNMNLYYDGASVDEIKEALDVGVITGVTTNLSFCKKEMNRRNISYEKLLSEIHNLLKKSKRNLSFSVQVSSNQPEKIFKEAVALNKKYSSGVDLKIKIPISYENSKIISLLVKQNIKVNATCVTSFLQGLCAAHLGCSYISFFWGKMTDEGIDSEKIVSQFNLLLNNNKNNFKSKILVGSIRQTAVITEAINAGADIVTLQNSNFKKILDQIKSNEANNIFQQDWNK